MHEHTPMSWPTIYLCRHGDTAWSPYRRFAGKTDIPLSEEGERNAAQLGRRLASVCFDRVITSPLQRALRTAHLAGYAGAAEVEPRLAEWCFGDYEGRTRDEVAREHPGWTYLRDGCPNGDTAQSIGVRADSLIEDLRRRNQLTLVFAHSVILRVIAARWLGLPPTCASNFHFSPAAVSILGFDPVDDAPAVLLWNDKSHLNGK